MSDSATTTTAEAQSPLREAWIMFRRNKPALVGMAILSLIILATLYGAFIFTGDAYDIVWAPHEPPLVTPGISTGH